MALIVIRTLDQTLIQDPKVVQIQVRDLTLALVVALLPVVVQIVKTQTVALTLARRINARTKSQSLCLLLTTRQ